MARAKNKSSKVSKSPKVNFELSTKNLVFLLKLSLTKPKIYADNIPFDLGFKKPLIFVLIVSTIQSSLALIIKVASTQNTSVLFLGISQIVFSLPMVILFTFTSAGIYFLISKALGGKGNYKGVVAISCYSTIPNILGVSFLGLVFSILVFFVQIVALKRLNDFSYIKAATAVVAPLLILLVMVFMLGLAGTLSLLNFG